jgi:hypothetical protein
MKQGQESCIMNNTYSFLKKSQCYANYKNNLSIGTQKVKGYFLSMVSATKSDPTQYQAIVQMLKIVGAARSQFQNKS